MPLKNGGGGGVISMNIKKLITEGYKPEQAAAIAFDKARKGKKGR